MKYAYTVYSNSTGVGADQDYYVADLIETYHSYRRIFLYHHKTYQGSLCVL